MRIAFFTEMEFSGKIPRIHDNMRTEFAWICALKADHYNIQTIPKENYDLGSGFYIKISENQTLYLQGQYYDQLSNFPNTDFEIVKSNLENNELISINVFGKYLKPENKLKPFTIEQFNKNDVHYDGEILNVKIENIK